MDRTELETPELFEATATDSLVELIVAASDTSEDAWEIGDRVAEALGSGRIQIDGL